MSLTLQNSFSCHSLFLMFSTVINEKCSYKIHLGKQPNIDVKRLLNAENSSALHLQMCATQDIEFPFAVKLWSL